MVVVVVVVVVERERERETVVIVMSLTMSRSPASTVQLSVGSATKARCFGVRSLPSQPRKKRPWRELLEIINSPPAGSLCCSRHARDRMEVTSGPNREPVQNS
jgi:hypothetical protein